MCLMIYLATVILLANGGQCELTWDKVYGLLSAKLDKIKLEQDVMKTEIKDLVTYVTAMNQRRISFEKRLSELATFSQHNVYVRERLDNIDSHVKTVATAEVGRRTHLLRRGLEQEKSVTQSRFISFQKAQEVVQSDINLLMSADDVIRNQISGVAQEIKSTMNQTAKLLSQTENEMNTHLNETRVQISYLEQEMADTMFNIFTFVERIETLEKTQSDMKGAANKTQAQIATVKHEIAVTHSNTQNVQFRVQILEGMQGKLKSKAMTIESRIDSTRGEMSRIQQTLGTFAGFHARLTTKKEYYDKNTVIIFHDVRYNWGSHYSPCTGIFTVPVSGAYVFMFNVEVHADVNNKDRDAHVVLRVNGYFNAEANVLGLGHGLTGGNAAVLDVISGDKVFVSTSTLKERYHIWSYRTLFTGALLHVH